MLPNHLFVSSTDGALYDCRIANWSNNPPLRANFCAGHRDIKSLADFKATLRNGGFAFPGGYPLYFVMKDGGALAFKTAQKEFARICRDLLDGYDTGWTPVGVDINYEDEIYDSHTGELIESAYGISSEEES